MRATNTLAFTEVVLTNKVVRAAAPPTGEGTLITASDRMAPSVFGRQRRFDFRLEQIPRIWSTNIRRGRFVILRLLAIY